MKFMILWSNEICWILICLWRVKIIMCILFCSKCWYMIQPTGYLPKRHWIIFTLQTLTSQPYRPPPSRVRSPSYNLHKLGVLPTAFHLITGTKHTDLSSSPLTLYLLHVLYIPPKHKIYLTLLLEIGIYMYHYKLL